MPLKALTSRVAGLPGRIKRQADDQGHDRSSDAARGWYKLARWQRLRLRVFLRDNYTCRCGCGAVTARPIADHIKPHRGDPALFWSETNVQTLTKPCHDRLKQAEEAQARARGG